MKKSTKIILTSCLTAGLVATSIIPAVALSSCFEDPNKKTTVKITTKIKEIDVSDPEITLEATTTNQGLNKFQWETSDPDIATVKGKGSTATLVPVSVGKATITVSLVDWDIAGNEKVIASSKITIKVTDKSSNKPNVDPNKPTGDKIELVTSKDPVRLDGYSTARAIQYNVAQGDAALIQLSKDNDFTTANDNYNILVDAGRVNKGLDDLGKQYCDKLVQDGVKNIDMMFISHFHYDHIGNFPYLLNAKKESRFTFNNLKVALNYSEYLYDYANGTVTATSKKTLTALKEKNATFYDSKDFLDNSTKTKQFLSIYDAANNYKGGIQILAGTDVNDKNVNSWTLINNFIWDNKKVLYSGDATGTTFNKMTAANKKLLASDVYKVAHHGSGTEGSNTLDFIQAINPKEAIISSGQDDSYTLPDTQVLETLLQVMKDASKIKGTQKFGKSFNEWLKDNPDGTQQQYDKKWGKLMAFIKKNPTINNNNKGYDDMLIDFSQPSGSMVSSLTRTK